MGGTLHTAPGGSAALTTSPTEPLLTRESYRRYGSNGAFDSHRLASAPLRAACQSNRALVLGGRCDIGRKLQDAVIPLRRYEQFSTDRQDISTAWRPPVRAAAIKHSSLIRIANLGPSRMTRRRERAPAYRGFAEAVRRDRGLLLSDRITSYKHEQLSLIHI